MPTLQLQSYKAMIAFSYSDADIYMYVTIKQQTT